MKKTYRNLAELKFRNKSTKYKKSNYLVVKNVNVYMGFIYIGYVVYIKNKYGINKSFIFDSR